CLFLSRSTVCAWPCRVPCAPPSFPTRRSSDLQAGRQAVDVLAVERCDEARVEPAHDRVGAFVPRLLALPHLLGDGFSVGVFEKIDRKSTRLNSSHVKISYAVFCLKKKNKRTTT